MTKHDPYFTPIDDDSTFTVPGTISGEEERPQQAYQYLPNETENNLEFKWLLITVAGLISTVIAWEVYTTLIELLAFNSLLFTLLLLLLVVVARLGVKEIYLFFKGRQQLKRVDEMRSYADNFIRERSHGKSTVFINELKLLYAQLPQGELLHKVLSNKPDYLNDAEIVTYLSENFFSQLDKEAQQYITSESIRIGTLIALSPLAIVDAFVVLWRAIKMVNQISGIYGLRLTRIGQWQAFIKILKATLLAASTEIAISSIVDKTTTGLTGVVAGNIAQGLGVAIYAAKVGVEGMKRSRPVMFSDNEQPNVNLIINGIRLGLMNVSSK